MTTPRAYRILWFLDKQIKQGLIKTKLRGSNAQYQQIYAYYSYLLETNFEYNYKKYCIS